MGLLSDPDPEAGGVRWARALVRWERAVCGCLWLAALAWLLALAHPACYNSSYFSENALLPGLVHSDFTDERVARRFHAELLEELEDKYAQRDDMPLPWLVGKMSQLHLEVYTHNFTLHYPLGHTQVFRGTNVYGVLRAAGTASLEALVVSVPYRPLSSPHKGTTAGLALMLAFAQHARPQKYWAKDIIFLVTEHEQLGMQAWLEAYHGISSAGVARDYLESLASLGGGGGGDGGGGGARRYLHAGELPARSGAIQAAINLELHSPSVKYVEVKVEGLNGQLPNLDLVNLAHKMCSKSGIHHSYRASNSWTPLHTDRERWASGVWTMLGHITAQLTGVPSGNHGLFHRFGIEAITLEGRDADDATLAPPPPRVAALAPANFRRLGVMLESTLRSLNNLLERFHQSYFFYLRPAADQFVSIGQYMPCLCLVCGALLVRALALWISLEREVEAEEGDKGEGGSPLAVGTNYLLQHVAGYLVVSSPAWFSRLGAQYWSLPTEQSVYAGVAAACAACAAAAAAAAGAARGGCAGAAPLVAALLELATVCLAVGTQNLALALALAALYAPLALLVAPATASARRVVGRASRLRVWAARAACAALHPLCVVTLALAACGVRLFPEETLPAALGRGVDAARQALLFSVVDSEIYGNWVFNVSCLLVLPVWSVLWQTLWAR